MTPILYDKTETQFNHNGIGKLTECSKCLVTEERNGIFELELQYPISGKYFKDIVEDAFIVCESSQNGKLQRFRIYKVTTPKSGTITVFACHVSYQLSFIPIRAFEANGITAALSGLKSNSVVTNPFSFTTDISSSAYWMIETPLDCKSCLKGADGSIVDVFGGELEFDNYNVRLLRNRGVQSGITISYGKNITDITKDIDSSSLITGLLPYIRKDDAIVYGDISYSGITTAFPRVVTEDVSQQFDSDETPSKSQITAAGRTALNNKILKSVEHLQVSFIPVWDSEADKARMQKLNLCDTVHVSYESLNIDREMKVIKTIYNVLRDRYESIELGEPKTILTTLIRKQAKQLQEEIQQTAYELSTEISETAEELSGEIQEEKTRAEKVEKEIINNQEQFSVTFKKYQQDQASEWSSIKQTVNEIDLEVGQKVGNNEIISKINMSSERISIQASKIDLTGVTSLYNTNKNLRAQINDNEMIFYGGVNCKITWGQALNLTSSGSLWLTGTQITANGGIVATQDWCESMFAPKK